jgi:hypothetical protein
MDLDGFLQHVSDPTLRLPILNQRISTTRAPERADALFHLPLLALAIMAIARRKPFQTVKLGTTVSRLLIERFTALRHAPRAFERSVTLRRRCVDALVFLETVGLVVVSQDTRRVISLTAKGKAEFDAARRAEGDLGLLVRHLRTAEDRVKARVGES